MLVIWVGAALVVAGILYMAGQAIRRGRLSGQDAARPAPAGTLEPPRRGVGFLGLGPNFPGVLLSGLGGILLVAGGYL